MTVAESKITAVVTALDGDQKPDGVNVNRSRRQPRQGSDLPIVSVYFANEDVDPARPNNALGSELTLRIRCVIWHAGPEESDALIEPIREYVVAKVMETLGRGCEYAGTEWEGEGLPETELAAAAVDFTVKYKILRGAIGKSLGS